MPKFLTQIDMTNQRIINVADPSTTTDVATKQYVDGVNQNTQLQIDQLQTQITNISLDPVTKAYVDDKFNEIMAMLAAHLHGPRGI